MARSLELIGRAFDDAHESDKALNYMLKAVSIYEGIDTDKGKKDNLADIYTLIGINYKNRSKYKSSYVFYNKALELYEEIDNKRGAGNALSNIGLVYRHQGDYNKAIEYYIRSLVMREKVNDQEGIAIIYGNLGNLYRDQDNISRSLEYYERAKNLFEQLGNKPSLAYTLNNLGILYKDQEKYEKAIEQHNQALEIFEEMGSRTNVASSFSNIGTIYNQQENYTASLENNRKALKLFQEVGNQALVAGRLIEIGFSLIKLKKFEEAYFNIQRGINLARETGNKNLEMQGYEILYQYYEAIGNYKKSLDIHKKYNNLKDSLFNIGKSEQIAEIQTKYEIDKKEGENELLRQEQIAKNAVIESKDFQNKLLFAGILFFLLFAGYFYINSQQKQKVNKLLSIRNEQINQKQEEIISINASLQKSQEQLFKVNEKLQALNVGLEGQVQHRTSALLRINEELDTFLYQSSHALRRPIVSVMGLIQIARLETNQLNVSGIYDKIDKTAARMDLMLRKLVMASEINFPTMDLEHIDYEIMLTEIWSALRASNKVGKMKFKMNVESGLNYQADRKLVSIMLENILENAIVFHFEAPDRRPLLDINIQSDGPNILLSIHDNGRGIPTDSLEKVFDMFTVANDAAQGFGLGLYISKKAIEKLGGNIRVESKKNEFTTILISLPR